MFHGTRAAAARKEQHVIISELWGRIYATFSSRPNNSIEIVVRQ